MQFSEHWLRSLVNPPLNSDELAHMLTMAGLEVEEMHPVAPPFNNVVVAHVLSVDMHPDADKLKIKSGLVIEITRALRKLGLTQQEAAKRMRITQPKVSDMMRGDFSNLSERKLMDCLNRLGYDIEIKVKPASEPVGHLMLAIA
mgnify:CR=1 FL=1